LEESLVADAYQFGQAEATTLILLDVRDDETKLRGDEPFGRFLVTSARTPRQLALFFGIFDQRVLLDVEEVLIERFQRAGVQEHISPFSRIGLKNTKAASPSTHDARCFLPKEPATPWPRVES